MIRIAFTQIGGSGWMGGLNYQVNLLTALCATEHGRIAPILFLGTDVDPAVLKRFQSINGLAIVQSRIFDHGWELGRLVMSLVTGIDYCALRLFRQHDIKAVFESADFYGWRFPINCIAWVPDLQHRRLRHYFGFFAFWKREIGFRMQIFGGRHIMVSSEDAKQDFQHFYPISAGKLHVVRFAVPVGMREFDLGRLTDQYGLPPSFFYMPNQFWRHKNHECVIRALAISRQAGQEFTVAVSGNPNDPRDPTYFPNLLSLARNLGVEKHFKVLGLIPYDDVQTLMVGCVALINPSRFEGWSTAVEEAKALGVSMLLSDIRVHREQAEGIARYFDVDDPEGLADLMKNQIDRPLVEKIRQANSGVQKAQRSMSEFAARFVDMVDKVIGQP